MDFILFIIGVIFIFIGSNLLIDNSKLIAISLNISPFIIGLTLIAFGTSLPELIVSIVASFDEKGDIVLGNVVGSNIANIALVLSLITIWKTIKIDYFSLKESLRYIIFSTIVLVFLIIYNKLIFISSFILLSIFITYIYSQFKIINTSNNIDKSQKENNLKVKYIIYSFIGIFLLGLGSEIFINGAIGIAKLLGIPLIIISLSIVALGTSVPELVTSFIAMRKNESSLVIGNILGSNIINIVLVLASSIIINPININIQIIQIPLLLMIFSTIILLYIIYTQKEIHRTHGLILFLIYIVFIYLNFSL